jgi:hypothetical protein
MRKWFVVGGVAAAPTDPGGTQALDRGPRANVHNLIAGLRAMERRRPTFFAFYVGRGDTRFRAENVQLDRELDAARVPHLFQLYPGGHETAVWKQHAPAWLGLALRHLASWPVPCAPEHILRARALAHKVRALAQRVCERGRQLRAPEAAAVVAVAHDEAGCDAEALMVSEERLLSPAEAVHRLTGRPAERLGLSDRGVLREGARADLVLFDAGRFADRGTTFEPNLLAEGVRHVIVNGVQTLRDGELTGDRAGMVLRR